MIKKLRKKFIAIAMCSMALVLFVIMAGINTANYTNVCRNADMRIHVIAEITESFRKVRQRTALWMTTRHLRNQKKKKN